VSSQFEASGGDPLTELFFEVSRTMGSDAVRQSPGDTATGPAAYETGSPLNSFYSGMSVSPIPVRDQINQRLMEAHEKWLSGGYDIEQVWEADAIANSINELEGVEVLQSADHIGHNNARCAHYAFGEYFGEEWAMPDEELDISIWNNTTSFLREKGYEPVAEPSEGDVVLYSFEDPRANGLEWVEHFAVLEEDGRAVSRFGQGPVVRHSLHAVPTMYGEKIYFFRKVRANSKQSQI